MRRLLLSVILLSSLSSFTVAQEPLVWTYSEGWWENATSDPANNCVTQDPAPDQGPKEICDNARFRLVVRQTVELNPAANAHGVEQIVQIKDLSTDLIVSQQIQNDFLTGTQSMFTAETSHEVDATPDGTGMGPFEGRVQHFPTCPDTGHPGGGGTIGSFGTAFLYYSFDRIQTPPTPGGTGVGWYIHRPHKNNSCPSICPSPTSALIVYAGNPGPYAVVLVPIAYWRCSWIGGGVSRPTLSMCWDLIYIS